MVCAEEQAVAVTTIWGYTMVEASTSSREAAGCKAERVRTDPESEP
jgi:hypothetical protein